MDSHETDQHAIEPPYAPKILQFMEDTGREKLKVQVYRVDYEDDKKWVECNIRLAKWVERCCICDDYDDGVDGEDLASLINLQIRENEEMLDGAGFDAVRVVHGRTLYSMTDESIAIAIDTASLDSILAGPDPDVNSESKEFYEERNNPTAYINIIDAAFDVEDPKHTHEMGGTWKEIEGRTSFEVGWMKVPVVFFWGFYARALLTGEGMEGSYVRPPGMMKEWGEGF